MITDWCSSPGVVPIFVNAGAALGPLIIAPVTTFLAALLRPRELAALVRRRPWLPVPVLAAAVGIWMLVAWMISPPAAVAGSRRAERPLAAAESGPAYWTRIAEEQIAAEKNAHKKTGLRPLWTYPADEGMVLCSPAFAGNRVFAGAAVQDVASFFGTLFALDAATGKEAWRLEKAGDEDLKPFFSSPVLSPDGKSILIGQGLHDHADCYLLCVSAETGQLRWKVKTTLHIESTPAVRGDLVVAGCGAIEDANHKPTTDPGHVIAVRISDGALLWKHPVNDPESSPAIGDDGTVYIGSGFNGNAVVALRSESDDELKAKGLSRELWKTPAKYPITGPVTLAGDVVIVGGGNGDFVYEAPNPAGVVMALDRKTGQVKWEVKTDAAVLGRIAVVAGKLYCPVRNGQVIALDLADGKRAWAQSVSGKAPVLGGVAASADGATLYAVSRDGYLAVLRAADGAVVEKHMLNSPGKAADKGLTLSTPTVAGDRVYIGSETGGLRAFQVIK